jgi:DNA-binding transcriptional LysR family regulator
MTDSQNNEFDQIKQYDFVLREEGSGTRKEMEEYLRIHGVEMSELKTVISIGSTEAVIAAVEAGLGISFISKLAAFPAAKANRVQLLDIFEPFQRSFYFTILKESETRPIIKEFMEINQLKIK